MNIPFVGRASELEKIRVQLDLCGARTKTVISLYGASGIGKTRLVNELRTQLDDSTDGDLKNTLIAKIDFESVRLTEPLWALLSIRRQLALAAKKARRPPKFYAFDLGLLSYLQNNYPELESEILRRDLFDSLVDEYSDALDQASEVGLEDAPMGVGSALKIVNKVRKLLKKREARVETGDIGELEDFDSQSMTEQARRLPLLLGHDISRYRRFPDASKILIVFDTYERLWRSDFHQVSDMSKSIDLWISDLALAASGLLTIISGRNPIEWSKKRISKLSIESIELLELSYSESLMALELAGVTEPLAREKIARRSQGDPLHIQIAADFAKELLSHGEELSDAGLDAEFHEIVQRFLGRYTEELQYTLLQLSVLGEFDSELFLSMLRDIPSGIAFGSFDVLCSLPFISVIGDGKYILKPRIQSLLVGLASDKHRGLVAGVRDFAFRYYDHRLSVIEGKPATRQYSDDLAKALTFANLRELEPIVKWFLSRLEPLAIYGVTYTVLAQLRTLHAAVMENIDVASERTRIELENSLFIALLGVERVSEARALLDRSLEEAARGRDLARRVRVNNKLALTYLETDLKTAISHSRKAFEDSRSLRPLDRDLIIQSSTTLTNMLLRASLLDEAIKVARIGIDAGFQAMDECIDSSAAMAEVYARVLSRIGKGRPKSLGDEGPVFWWRKSLELYRSSKKTSPLGLVSVIMNLATFYMITHMYSEAQGAFLEAISILSGTLAERSKTGLFIRTNYVYAMHAGGKILESKEQLEAVIQDWDEVGLFDDPALSSASYKLCGAQSLLLGTLGDFDGALRANERALEYSKLVRKQYLPDTVAILIGRIGLLRGAGRVVEIAEVERRIELLWSALSPAERRRMQDGFQVVTFPGIG